MTKILPKRLQQQIIHEANRRSQIQRPPVRRLPAPLQQQIRELNQPVIVIVVIPQAIELAMMLQGLAPPPAMIDTSDSDSN